MFIDYYQRLVFKYFGAGKKNLPFLFCLILSGQISGFLFWLFLTCFGLFCLAYEHGSTQTDSGISQAIRGADKISMSKNIFGEGKVEITLTAEKITSFEKNTTDVWQKYGYFKQQPCDFGTEKDNFPENLVFYINQGYQSYKDDKKAYYVDYYTVGQINQCLNPPESLNSYEFKENEAKIYRPRYDTVSDQFLGLYETLGYLMAQGDSDEWFFDYGFLKQNSKILHSYHKNRTLNSSFGTFFNRHRIQYESGAFNTESSKIYFFLPSITDRSKDINRHMGSVNLIPIDISEDSFEEEGEIAFDPSKLDYDNPDREKMRQDVMKVL